MAEVELRVGAKLDLLNRHELSDALRVHGDSYWREKTVGVKWTRYVQNLPGLPVTYQVPGPELGFTWDVRMISSTLTASDTLAAYVGESANNRLVASNPAATLQVVALPSRSVIVTGGEGLFLATGGTGHLTNLMVAVVQVPSEMVGKLLT